MNWKWKLAQAAEIRWWKYYLSPKTPEAYLRDKKAYWTRFLQQVQVNISDESRVLDAGCGPAGIFMVLPDQKVDALDPLLDEYQRELAHFDPKAYPWVRFISGSLEQFIPEQKYSLIFCLNAINHVADLGLAIDRLRACLSSGATLWISVDAHRFSWLRWIFQKIPGDILHPHQYTLDEYRKMLAAGGLEVRKSIKLKSGKIFEYHLLEVVNN